MPPARRRRIGANLELLASAPLLGSPARARREGEAVRAAARSPPSARLAGAPRHVGAQRRWPSRPRRPRVLSHQLQAFRKEMVDASKGGCSALLQVASEVP